MSYSFKEMQGSGKQLIKENEHLQGNEGGGDQWAQKWGLAGLAKFHF